MKATHVSRVFVIGTAMLVSGWGCGHTTAVRPVEQGVVAAEVALGGPIADVGPVIPLPLSTAGARYGIHPRVDVGAHLHLTSLAFGVVGADVGSTWLLLEQNGAIPAIAANGRLYGFTDVQVGQPRAFLELTPSVSWLLGDRYLTYVTGSGLVQFAGGRPLFSVGAGEEVRFGNFSLQAELRWYQPDYETTFTVVDWSPVFGMGGWGAVVGASYRFGGAR